MVLRVNDTQRYLIRNRTGKEQDLYILIKQRDDLSFDGLDIQDNCDSVVQRGRVSWKRISQNSGAVQELRRTELAECGERYDRQLKSPWEGHKGRGGPSLEHSTEMCPGAWSTQLCEQPRGR